MADTMGRGHAPDATGPHIARNVERGDHVVGDSLSAAAPLLEIDVFDPLHVVIDAPQRVAMHSRRRWILVPPSTTVTRPWAATWAMTKEVLPGVASGRT